MTNDLNIQAIANLAAQQGPNMNEAKTGGGYTPPAAGMAIAILVGYVETGMHASEYQGKPKAPAPMFEAVFELHSQNHSQRVGEDGKRIAERITVRGSISLNEKATFYKLFKKLNHDGKATHMAQLVGKHWLVRVINTTKGEGAEKRTYAALKDESGFTFQPPVRPGDPLTGGADTPIACPERLSPLRLFLWDFATKDQWDSIFIDGEYEEERDASGKVTRAAKSKNIWQDKIRTATNFAGSPIAELLAAGSLSFAADAVPEVAAAPAAAPAPANDPLAGIGGLS